MGVSSASGQIESGDDKLRRVHEIVENSNDWFALQTGFIDRYVRNELHLVIRSALPDLAQYGFLVEAQRPSRDGDEIAVGGLPADHGQPQGPHLDFQEPSVFPLDVELMEEPKRLVPSLIRFQRFDHLTWQIGEPLYEFRALKPAPGFENHLGLRDRKVMVVGLRYAVAVGERRSHNINAAAQSVDIGPGLDVERARQRSFWDRHYRVIRALRWRLFNTYFDIGPKPCTEAFRETWELGYGPLNAGLSV